jgi:iron only hydrogenase large subunit-like protein
VHVLPSSDVDHVITTRELGQALRERGIDLPSLPETPYDSPFGTSTGAAAIFGTTGGVMEAALRTAYERITGERMQHLELQPVRGLEVRGQRRNAIG